MLKLLNNPTSDNERNVLNADLFVSNLKNNLKAFGFDPKVKYEVYRRITIYHISWLNDKTYDDLYKLRKEVALSLGIRWEDLDLSKVSENEAIIKVQNMKNEPLTLKEVLSEFKKDDEFKIALGMDEYDKVVYLDLDREKNLLVTGVSGSGKSNLFNNIIMNILINYSDTKIIVLDSESINYNIYDSVLEVVKEEEDIIAKIKEIRKEFEERVKSGKNARLIVFIDEVYKIIARDSSVKDDINYLLELGSTMNIHLIISSDNIASEDIYDLFKRDNISKISFYMTSRGEYYLFLKLVVNEKLNNDGIYVNIDKESVRLSVPLVMDEEIRRVVNYCEKDKR